MRTVSIDPSAATGANRTRAFTLIELLVVLAIIAILASIGLLVANRVSGGGKEAATKDLLKILDSTLQSIAADKGPKLPSLWTDESLNKNQYPLFDGRIGNNPGSDPVANPAEPSLTWYLLLTGESTSVSAAMGGLDPRFVLKAPIVTSLTAGQKEILTGMPNAPQTSAGGVVSGLVIKDAWGEPIRFVHPTYQGGSGAFAISNGSGGWSMGPSRQSQMKSFKQGAGSQQVTMRRSWRADTAGGIGDADEGLCPGGAPYFYSVGEDKDPGLRKGTGGENVYLIEPKFTPETSKIVD